MLIQFRFEQKKSLRLKSALYSRFSQAALHFKSNVSQNTERKNHLASYHRERRATEGTGGELTGNSVDGSEWAEDPDRADG